jgi:Tol biopolymer transport system component
MRPLRPLLGRCGVLLVLVDGPSTAEFSATDKTQITSELFAALGLLRTLGQTWAGQQNPMIGRPPCDFAITQVTVKLALVPGIDVPASPPHNPTTLADAAKFDQIDRVWLKVALAELGFTGTLDESVAALADSRSTSFVLGPIDDVVPLFVTKYGTHHIAYADRGGQFAVIQLPETQAVYPFSVDRVIAHELGHVLRAPDEYDPMCQVGDISGPFDTPNDNCECSIRALPISAHQPGACLIPNGASGFCLMQRNHPVLCRSTPLHWGWQDADQDGLVDLAAPPTITVMEPRAATAGSLIQIRGRNLWDVRFVRFGNDVTTDIRYPETVGGVPTGQTSPLNRATLGKRYDTEAIFVVVPRGPDGPVEVTVGTRGGESSPSDGLFFRGPVDVPTSGEPAVFGLIPSFGFAGTPVTILGANLENPLDVFFGGTAATNFTPCQDFTCSVLFAEAPAGPGPGPTRVSVRNVEGTSAPSLFAVFNYLGAVDAHLVTDEDAARAFDPLGNDQGSLVRASVTVTQPAHGRADATNTGLVTYTPGRHYNGVDSFSYTICDMADVCATASVTVSVRPFGRYRILATSADINHGEGFIELMQPDGSGPRERMPFAFGSMGMISPNGAWLAIVNGGSVAIYNTTDSQDHATTSFPRQVDTLSWAPDSSQLVVGASKKLYTAKPLESAANSEPLTYEVSDGAGGTVRMPVIGQTPSWGPRGISISDWFEWTDPFTGRQHTGLAVLTPGNKPAVVTTTPDLYYADAAEDGTLVMRCPTGICTLAPNDSAVSTLKALPTFQSARNLRWSPDGSKIAFDLVDSDVRSAVMNRDGSGLQELDLTGPVRWPSWDPRPYTPTRPWDCPGQLAFIRTDNAHPAAPHTVEVMNPDGSGRRSVTSSAGGSGVGSPEEVAWSPDSEQLAMVVHTPSGEGFQLDVMAADGSARRTLSLGLTGQLAWSPDGREICFAMETATNPAGLYAIHPDGTGLRPIVTVTRPLSPLYQSYSPDGRYLLYKSPGESGGPVYVVRADGSAAPLLLTGLPSNIIHAPDVSSRSQLVYAASTGLFVGNLVWEPTPAVSAAHQIVFAGGWDPAWSPDGRAIGYHTGSLSNNLRVWVVNADGSRPTQVSVEDSSANDTAVAWGASPPRVTDLSPRFGPTPSGNLRRPRM